VPRPLRDSTLRRCGAVGRAQPALAFFGPARHNVLDGRFAALGGLLMRRDLPIEKLVEWCFRDELPKLRTSSAEGIWDAIGRIGSLGITPEKRSFIPQRYDFGLPDPDAKIIAVAVSALPAMAIDWELSRESLMGDAAGLLEVRDTLLLRSINVAALITMHGSMGTAPDWRTEEMRPYMVPPAHGDQSRASIVGERTGQNRYTIGSYCPLQWEPSPVSVALARGDYAAWHAGLVMLAETLHLEKHKAMPPTAPAQPWFDAPKPARVWFVGDHAIKRAALPLRPSRPYPVKQPGEARPRPGKVRHPLAAAAK
jgi:hypothetical protein